MEILIQAFSKIKRVRKQNLNFFVAYIIGLIGSIGRKTFRNLSRFTNIEEHTFSRQTAKEIDTVGLNAAMIGASKSDGDILIGAQDATFVPKAGKKTHGLDYFWYGSAGVVEKGLEADTIGIVRIDKDRNKEGYGLSVKQTPANPTPYAQRKKKKKGDVTRIDFYLEHLLSVLPQLQELHIKHVAVDNLLANDKYVNGAVAAGIHVVSKGRKNMQLKRLYTGPQKSRGRPRKFDTSRIRHEDFEKSSVISFVDEDGHKIEFRECIGHSVALKREIKVVLVRKYVNANTYGEAYLFSTDLQLSALDIYTYYTARFQIEFVFRDAKNFTGFIDCQSRDPRRIQYHFNASITALNVAKLQDRSLQVAASIHAPFSMANWTRKFIVDFIINRFIDVFGLDKLAIKSNPLYKEVLAFGSIMH